VGIWHLTKNFNLHNTYQKSNHQTLFLHSEKQNNWQTITCQKFRLTPDSKLFEHEPRRSLNMWLWSPLIAGHAFRKRWIKCAENWVLGFRIRVQVSIWKRKSIDSNVFQWLFMPKLSLVFDYLTSNKKVLFCNRNQKINCQTLVLYSDQGNTVTDIQEQIRNFVCRLAADPKNLKSCPCTVTPLMVLRKQDTVLRLSAAQGCVHVPARPFPLQFTSSPFAFEAVVPLLVFFH